MAGRHHPEDRGQDGLGDREDGAVRADVRRPRRPAETDLAAELIDMLGEDLTNPGMLGSAAGFKNINLGRAVVYRCSGLERTRWHRAPVFRVPVLTTKLPAHAACHISRLIDHHIVRLGRVDDGPLDEVAPGYRGRGNSY